MGQTEREKGVIWVCSLYVEVIEVDRLQRRDRRFYGEKIWAQKIKK